MSYIKDVNPKKIAPGISGYYVHGDKHTLGRVEITKGSIVPEHHHLHEQITYILKGQLDMIIGGRQYSLTEGMYHVIYAHIPHSALAITDCIVIDTFSPVREDYKNA
ncbi:MAG: cupin domain-containing protein [Bacteroidota bacterium]|nr:cupin domain-containing protein [Bacteroidota bacterium]